MNAILLLYSFQPVCGFLLSCEVVNTEEMEATVYRPYMRILTSPTIYRFNYKGSTLHSVNFGLAPVRAPGLPHGRPTLNKPSQPVGGRLQLDDRELKKRRRRR